MVFERKYGNWPERTQNGDLRLYLEVIGHGPNMLIYTQLLENRDRFDADTWRLGINYFFMGKEGWLQDAEAYLEHNSTHIGSVLSERDGIIDLDTFRAIELKQGKFKLPASWDDLYELAQKRREEIGQELISLGEEFQNTDPEIRRIIQIAIVDGEKFEDLYEKYPEQEDVIFTAQTIRLYQKHIEAISKSLEIIEELKRANKISDKLVYTGKIACLSD